MADLKNMGQEVASEVKRGARRGAQAVTGHAAPGLDLLARVGYASKGVVYSAVGLLALGVALGQGGATTDMQGALLRLQDIPGGSLLLWVLAAGLLGYATWQLIRALLDPEHQGTGPKGLGKRAGYLLSGVANTGLALFSARLALLGTATRQQNSEDRAAAAVLNLPAGRLLLTAIGLFLLGVAAYQLYVAYGAKFMKRMAFHDISERLRGVLVKIGQMGITARGLLMLVIGSFALLAAWRGRAREAVGVSEALTWLRDQPAGNVLLGAVALGTLCYGLWCGVQALYRRIRVEDAA
ncbi:DUF1206 domain-containing protein [Deinococcus multiflagellatus]|uniref:DUF1206 domain-containing protein n=1 Tax=Deinococcus multiflagellatus TaxID=1656887 RepID=UPI001CCCF1CC|nr:DUF1206 domain-containing protein [Deinococcus multiflagellatus]MBZ9712331.1 DUF1206 domain-containing protein [Deinococcus multiflagellatus]